MASGYFIQHSEMAATLFAGVVVPALFSAALLGLYWLGARRPVARKPTVHTRTAPTSGREAT